MVYTSPGTFVDGSTAVPLSAATLNTMNQGIISAHQAIDGTLMGTAASFNVKAYGATGNGSTDDTAAIIKARNAAIATKGAAGTTGPTRAELVFPPGNYRITQNDTLMSPSSGTGDGITGLTIRGYGKGVTTLSFTPNATSTTNPWVGNLFSSNKRWRHSVVKDMTIVSNNSEANCFYFYHDGGGSNMNQGDLFENIDFRGNWRRVFGFDGGSTANLNSEMTFRRLSGATATYSDAFFKVGGISGTYNQQNQFLDYWFYDSFFILNGGTLFDFVKGGAAHFVGGSWSASSSASPSMTFLKFRQNSNNTSAANFVVDGVRMEPKARNHITLDD